MGSELQFAEGRWEPKWGREASQSSSSSVAILALAAQMNFEGSKYENLSAAAICATKRNVRRHGPANRLDYHVRPVDWSTKFQRTLGSFEEFLKKRSDQFKVLPHPDGMGHTVKDVTGNKTVAPEDRFVFKSPECQKRRSTLSRRTGSGVAKPILQSWKQAWAREESGKRKQRVVAAEGQRRSPSLNPRPQKRRLAKERRSPSAMERAKKAGGGGSGAIHRVLGDWVDTCRNEYEVQLDKGGTSCTVKTARPDGTIRMTKALIRLARGSLIWGQSHVLDTRWEPKTQLRWLRRGFKSKNFVWRRI